MAACSISSYAQLNDSTYRESVKKEYLRKSRNQRTTGFILLGVGAGLALTGAIIFNSSKDDIDQVLVETTSGAGLVTVGMISGVASIPFFIMSASNNKKAKTLSAGISFEKIMNNEARVPYPDYYPALTARIRF